MQINMSLSNVGSHSERLSDLQQQIATGKRIIRPSDDPIGIANSIKLTVKKSSVEVYNTNLVYAKTNLADSDSALGDVGNMLSRFKELSVRAANNTLTQNDRDIIANEMQALIEQVLSDANLKNAAGYAFGGSKNQNEPFSFSIGGGRVMNLSENLSGATLINDVAYNGDRSEIRMNESESSKIVSNINGETAFMNVTRQSVYSTKAFGDINRAPAMDNLKPGYFTIKGRGYEEIVKIDGGESLQAIADKINKGSQIAYAKIIEDKGAYRFVLEAREKGAANQFALIEGATGFERARTNFLEAAGLNSKVEFAGAGVADPGSSLAFQLNDIKNGNFYINGRLIKVDVNKDSLNDIAKKINDGVKNVYAKVSKGSDGLSRLSLEGAGSLIVENDTSGLMEKLGLARSRYKSTAVIADAFVSAQPLSKNEWVKNGNFKINNVNVGIVDAASETLETIKDRINGIAGINATASIEGGRFVISAGNPPDPSSRLSNITDGTSEFIKSFEFSYQGKDLGAAVTENSSVVGTLGVAAGSRFAINGKEFSVDAADTLKTLMEKINSSNIGVMASFNGGRFELSPLGNKESLNLNNFSDVTGDFFSKIAMGNRMASRASITSPMLAKSIGDQGVAAGTLSVNGASVNYTPADALSDVVKKINTAAPGVKAYVNSDNQLVIDSASPIDLKDSSNFLEKMAIKEEKIVDSNNRTSIKRSSENAQSIFDILIEIRDQLFNGDVNGLANNSKDDGSSVVSYKSGLAKLDEAISHIADTREMTGSALTQVERSTARNKEIEVYINKMITETEGVDFEKAVVELNTVDLIYRSALQVSAKINQQSLLDFLK